MNFNSKRNKLKLNYDLSEQNKNVLLSKENKLKTALPHNQNFKNVQVLYDSDWITPVTYSETIIGEEPAYFIYSSNTAKKEQQTPFQLFYSFYQNFDISEKYLPFIKPILLTNQFSNIQVEGVMPFQKYEYGNDYYKIYGDLVKIYEGNRPDITLLSETRRIAEEFDTNLASKWYYGTLKYSIGSDQYEMRNGYIDTVQTYYDVEPLAGHPGYYSYKRFTAPAIDLISSSSVTGTGTLLVVTAYEDEEGDPHTSGVSTKNYTLTAPLFENTTVFGVSGSLYKNDIFQQFYLNTNPHAVSFEGDFGGSSILVSFSYAWQEPFQFWKLFYSNKRAKAFRFNSGLGELYNLPSTTDYQTETLPYTNLFVDENPTDYPIIELENSTHYNNGYNSDIWTQIADNKFTFRIKGMVVLSAPANIESFTSVETIDESYSKVGDTYLRDSENRDDKDLPLYKPDGAGIKIRLLLCYCNFFENNSVQNYKV